jgi:hypothetical protein
VAAGLLAAIVSLASSPAAAQPKPLNAEVVWARGNRAHIASTDSIPVEIDDLLDFQVRGKTKAAGVVAEIHEAGLITARITSGSLDREKKLREVRIRAEPASLPRLTTMRIGVPGRNRRCPLFVCPPQWLPYGWGAPNGYRSTTIAGTSPQAGFVRIDSIPLDGAWPDTIVLIPFEDAVDQGIAIDRGDVDLSIFYPGDPSPFVPTRRRDWKEVIYGTRPRGVLAAIRFEDGDAGASSVAGSGPTEDSALEALNRDLFSGDLVRLSTGPPRGRLLAWGMPIAAPMNTALSKATPSMPAPSDMTVLTYLEAAADRPDSLRVEGRECMRRVLPEFADRIARGDPIVVTPLFGIRFPLVAGPPVRRLVRALGPDHFAALLDCRPIYPRR